MNPSRPTLASSPRAARGARLAPPRRQAAGQRGMTLIELMIGIALGLMTIAVAVAALMTSRGVSGAVGDASHLHQQASLALRVVGQQLRQAGSAELNLASTKAAGQPFEHDDPVAFMKTGYAAPTDIVRGLDAPSTGQYKLTVGYRNYWEQNQAGSATTSLLRDCLGQGGAVAANARLESAFVLDTASGELRCNPSSGGGPQAIIRNVADFQVAYFTQTAGVGTPTVRRVNAAGVASWGEVYAVEVCLDLVGDEALSVPSTSTYTNCAGTATSYGNRMHMVFRNTFQIRSQGLFTP